LGAEHPELARELELHASILRKLEMFAEAEKEGVRAMRIRIRLAVAAERHAAARQ